MLIRKIIIKDKQGFTFLEMMIVLAIIAVLVAIAIPGIGGYQALAVNTAEDYDAEIIAHSVCVLITGNRIALPESGEKTLTLDDESNDPEVVLIRDMLQTVPEDSLGVASWTIRIGGSGDVRVANSAGVIEDEETVDENDSDSGVSGDDGEISGGDDSGSTGIGTVTGDKVKDKDIKDKDKKDKK